MIAVSLTCAGLLIAALSLGGGWLLGRTQRNRDDVDATEWTAPDLDPLKGAPPLVQLAEPWPLFDGLEADWARRPVPFGVTPGPLWADIIARDSVCVPCRSGHHEGCLGCSCQAHAVLDELDLELLLMPELETSR